MDIPRLWALPRIKPYLKQAKARSSVHLAKQFHIILEREKARAIRNAYQFSLVLFEVSNTGGDISQVRCLTHSLVNRIRWTDEAGWFDNRHIGVVLPHTSGVGARRFADSVCEAVKAKTSAPEYTVYTYPSESFPNGNGHYVQLSFADLFPQWEKGMSRDCSKFLDRDGLGSSALDTRQLLADITLNDMTQPQKLEPFYRQPIQMWKRAFDILGSVIALIALSPLFLFVSLLIKGVSKGPVFFRQKRVGYMGKAFTMWKFRTMKVNADATKHKVYVTNLINGVAQNGIVGEKPMTKLDNDKERIPFGKILRKMCIDELPQLINVLYGEMSLVGPRPALPYEVELYSPWHFRRFDIIPGMTGLWQVSGKNRLSFNEMVRLDIRYARELSLGLDIKILLKTPFVVVSQIIDALQGKQVLSEHMVEKCLTLQ
jgi:lipopolysaccharide/colanic/teichoic acid biosynthesis glycosyltransferase